MRVQVTKFSPNVDADGVVGEGGNADCVFEDGSVGVLEIRGPVARVIKSPGKFILSLAPRLVAVSYRRRDGGNGVFNRTYFAPVNATPEAAK